MDLEWDSLLYLLEPSCLALIGEHPGVDSSDSACATHRSILCVVLSRLQGAPILDSFLPPAGTAAGVVLASAVRALGEWATNRAAQVAVPLWPCKPLPPGPPRACTPAPLSHSPHLCAGTSNTPCCADYEMTLSRMGIHSEEGSFTLGGQHALLLPVLASCSLLVVFYLFASIQLLILGLVCLSSVAAVAFALQPLLAALAARGEDGGRWLQAPVSLCGTQLSADQVGAACNNGACSELGH